ncbi:hypothetical protein BJX65DRAFT_317505 [Aspergillus insuetus]
MSDLADDHEADNEQSSTLNTYREFIFASPAYQWLLETLHKKLNLASPESSVNEILDGLIVGALPRTRNVSRRKSAQSFKAKFEMQWNPVSFFNDQMYGQSLDEVFGKVITLTGSAEYTQALPCAAYMAQTWPSTGTAILNLVKNAVCCCSGPGKSAILPDSTEVIVSFDETTCTTQVTGPAPSIAEVAEQLTWLAAALRSSSSGHGVAYCSPTVENVQKRDTAQIGDYDLVFSIDLTARVAATTDMSANGQCWYNLFRNPVVVEGYPILRRSKGADNHGLEIPLNMMAGLVQASRMNRFDESLVIKGFSAMLVPTRQAGDLLIWHLVYNRNGGRVSYLDYALCGLALVVFPMSWLPRPQETDESARASIHAGLMVVGTDSFVLGHKGTPSHISRQNGYILKLRWLAKKFVVLWDEDDKRGWHVSGTSALLHILRASLKHDSEGDFQDVFLFKPSLLREPAQKDEASFAIKVLLDPTNRGLKLYPHDKDSYFLLEDRAEGIYNMLEQIFDHQAGQHVAASSRPLGQLEGWDFKDLATDQDPCHMRVATLKTYGKAWVKLTRDINAVTLFGRGFGELIRPTTGGICHSCAGHWAELPKDRCYLAAGIPDIKRIMDLYGSQRAGHGRLTENLIWHSPDSLFVSCKCRLDGTAAHNDPVQVLLPSTWPTPFTPISPGNIGNTGAVIFGHNSLFKYIWGDFGHPTEGDVELLSGECDAQFSDSGIGPSVQSAGKSVTGSTGLDEPAIADYTIGIVCALHKELLAIRALFDERHDKEIIIPSRDTNHYALGRIGQHNVVAACLPSGNYGTNSAADVVSHMVRTFPVKFCLLVGIGGGVPSERNDVRLGDVIVSQAGVVQYDFGKRLLNGEFGSRGIVHRPPRYLMTAISSLEADPSNHSPKVLQGYINEITSQRPEYRCPGRLNDILFAPEYPHRTATREETCAKCTGPRIERPRRRRNHPRIHYGLIASGNQVIKDAVARDHLARERGILCFEMEAAGVMDSVECLVIRGVCDYADSHKNDIWQEYASATAAAYTKMLLSVVRPVESKFYKAPNMKPLHP